MNDTPASDVLPDVMRKLGMKGAYTLNALVTEWASIVGEENAKHCRPAKLERGQLTVHVEDHIWNMTLKRHVRQFLSKVKSRFPEKGVNRIFFMIDPEIYDPQAAPKHYIPNFNRRERLAGPNAKKRTSPMASKRKIQHPLEVRAYAKELRRAHRLYRSAHWQRLGSVGLALHRRDKQWASCRLLVQKGHSHRQPWFV